MCYKKSEINFILYYYFSKLYFVKLIKYSNCQRLKQIMGQVKDQWMHRVTLVPPDGANVNCLTTIDFITMRFQKHFPKSKLNQKQLFTDPQQIWSAREFSILAKPFLEFNQKNTNLVG